MSSGDSRLRNSIQAASLASHGGASIRAVPSGATTHPRRRASDYDGRYDSDVPQTSRGAVRRRCSADTMVSISDAAYPDQSKYGTNPLAPDMAPPSYEATAMSTRDLSCNPLARGFSNASNWSSNWSQREAESSRYARPSRRGSMTTNNTGTWDSHLAARHREYMAHRPSVRSRVGRSDSTLKPQPPASYTSTGDEAGGLRSRSQTMFRSSSSGSAPISPNSGDEFATRLERVPLLERAPTSGRPGNDPWRRESKRSVREMAARFEKVDWGPVPRARAHGLSPHRGGSLGSGRSASCPVDARRASLDGSLEEAVLGVADDPFGVSRAGDAVGLEGDRTERAWGRLTTALEKMPPDDLAMLQDILLSQREGSQPRSSGEKGGRPCGGPGER